MFEVKATGGDTHLGGEDFDNEVVNYCAEEYKRKTGLNVKTNPRAMRRLRTACERAKRTLSNATTATLEVDSLMDGQDFQMTLTRAKFESLCAALFTRCLRPVEQCLRDAKLSKGEIHDVVLVGGSTRIPKIQELLREYFGGKELCRSINPDEAVAYGAAVQAYILSGGKSEKTDGLVVCDVAPLSLGVETAGGIMTPIIPRATTIPTKKSKTFSTFADNQTGVSIQIYEGERARTADNRLLGQFRLEGIPPAPRGVPQIEVSLDVDANGILNVSAVEKGTGKSHKITITNDKGRLSKEEVERMVAQAEEFAAQDKLVRDRAEARNKLESYLHTVKHSSTDPETATKLGEEDAAALGRIAGEGLAWLESHEHETEPEVFDEQYKSVEAAVKPIMMRLYSKGGPDEGVGSATAAGPKVDEVD